MRGIQDPKDWAGDAGRAVDRMADELGAELAAAGVRTVRQVRAESTTTRAARRLGHGHEPRTHAVGEAGRTLCGRVSPDGLAAPFSDERAAAAPTCSRCLLRDPRQGGGLPPRVGGRAALGGGEGESPRVVVSVPGAMLEALDGEAAAAGLSRSEAVREAVGRWVAARRGGVVG